MLVPIWAPRYYLARLRVAALSIVVLAVTAVALVPSSASATWPHKHCKHCGPGGYGPYGSYGNYGYGSTWHWSAYTTCNGLWCGFLYPSSPAPVWGPSWHGIYYPTNSAFGMTPYGYIAPPNGVDTMAVGGPSLVQKNRGASPAEIAEYFRAHNISPQHLQGGTATVVDLTQPRNDAAMLYISAPAGARVYVNGKAATSVDASQPFLVTDLKPNEAREVELLAEVEQNGKLVSQARVLSLQAGDSMTVVINLEAPKPQSQTASKPQSPRGSK